MRHMTSQLREAATRRHVIDAQVAPADHTPHNTQVAHTVRAAACWAEMMAVRLSMSASQSRQSVPPLPQTSPTVRASSDFTAQVMARLATPPPEPDPRETRAEQARAHMRRFASIYLALVLASGVALMLLATVAPWVLLGLVTGIVSLALLAMTFASFISRLTDGVISGFGVAWLAMLAALAPPLLLLARRTARRRYSPSRRL